MTLVEFGDMVAAYRRTCGGCPTQYEGTLRDGRTFYFRYRYGYASLGIGATLADATSDPYEAGIQHGSDMAGVMNENEFKAMLVRLALIRGAT